ncbi:MAG: DNA polymerase III subunit beta [Oscillospiraceae bacterium]|nr:DNA polymerase III subunit beta [Oscillospiraceae bacterium]
MMCKCKQAILMEAVGNVSRAVPVKSPVSSLEGIKMYLSGNELELTGYDLELGIQTKIEVDSEDHGEFTVNAKLFSEIIRKLPSETVEVEIDEKLKTTIKGGDAEYNILALSADDYPSMPDYDTSDSFTLPQGILKNMINQTIFAVSVSDNKPILTGELFDIKDGIFNLVAIDGFRLAVRTEKINTEDSYNFVVKAKALSEISKLLKDDGEKKVTVYVSRKHAVFDINGYMVISRLLEGEFHNYKGSIPNSHGTEINVNTKSLIASLERCSLLIVEQTKAPVKCSFGDGQVKISCSTTLGKLSDVFPLDITGNKVEIGFNCKYLLDALKAAESDKVKLLLNSSTSPMKIVPADGDAYTFLVLPVRLKNN